MPQKIYFKSKRIEKLEAILRRIPSSHPARTKAESWLSISNAGERGERSLDYYLSFVEGKEYIIFNGIRLSSGNFYFQIDTLLINPNFILLLEVKNLAGTLIFDTDHAQLIQQFENKEVMHKDPIQQVDHQLFQFQEWMERHDFPRNIPLYSYVVITNEKCKIVPSNNNDLLIKKLIRKDVLRNTIRNLEELHKKEFISNINLTRLRDMLIKHHTPHNPDLLKQLQISRDAIITGVQCPRCYLIPMKRVYGKWMCLECKTTSKNAHVDTLHDYFLLIQPTITNQQLRKYLHIESVKTANYLLQKLNIKHHGNKRNRTYDLTSLWLQKRPTCHYR